jgi:protein phosphatase
MPLTSDDSVTGLMVSTGQMTHDEAEASTLRHTLTNCLGQTSFRLNIVRGRELRENDIFLLCSDGVHDLVSENELDEIIAGNRCLDAAMTGIVERAVSHGGHDNISAILVGYGHSEMKNTETAPPSLAYAVDTASSAPEQQSIEDGTGNIPQSEEVSHE